MTYLLKITLRLLLAVLLGGIIGAERERTDRPAGFRTYILVCVGSALVMVTSEYIFQKYNTLVNLDPARLGAQVISGIGFLGAGTIIREGFTVRGLTTAASLWAVSCIGLAVGIGLYSGAIVTTILVFITLIILKKAEFNLLFRKKYRTVVVETENFPDKLFEIMKLFEKHDIGIKNMDFISTDENAATIKITIKLPDKAIDLKAVYDVIGTITTNKIIYDE